MTDPNTLRAVLAARHVASQLGATIRTEPLYEPDVGCHSYGFAIVDEPTSAPPQTDLDTLRGESPLRLDVQLEAMDKDGGLPVHITSGATDDPTIIETINLSATTQTATDE